MRQPRAITLVETLLVIGVIGILIGLLAPALRGARSSAGATASLANLAGIGRSLEVYAGANRMRAPFPPRAEDASSLGNGPMFGPVFHTPERSPDAARNFFAPVFRMDRIWPTVMHDAAPWEAHYATWLSPGLHVPDGEEPIWERAPSVSYRYSNSFVASPRVWSGQPGATWDDVGPQLMSSVAHPSVKVVMYDADRSYMGRAATPTDARPLLFVDGSASLRLDRDARAPAKNALTDSARRYHDTPDGIFGADF